MLDGFDDDEQDQGKNYEKKVSAALNLANEKPSII